MAQTYQIRIVHKVNEIERDAWNQLVGDGSPFMKWDWLDVLETTGCVREETGWAPHHIVVEKGDALVGACPMYLKGHSMGEFVFDHEWASYAMQAGIRYYPKMLVGVPFTPVSGSRFVTGPRGNRKEIIKLLGQALMQVCESNQLSSIHINFCLRDEMEGLSKIGFIPKIGIQFHWQNRNYGSFDDYLGAFRSNRRNKIKRERREITEQGIQIRPVEHRDLTRGILRTMFHLYKHHIDRLYYGRQYLNVEFFEELLHRPFPHLCPIVAERENRIIAGTFNIHDQNALYGRYWGAFEDHRYLHFNVCYYAAIEHCINKGLERFEAGAGGSFKSLRGLEPQKTYSAHFILDPKFRRALDHYLKEERAEMVARQEMLLERSPLKGREQGERGKRGEGENV